MRRHLRCTTATAAETAALRDSRDGCLPLNLTPYSSSYPLKCRFILRRSARWPIWRNCLGVSSSSRSRQAARPVSPAMMQPNGWISPITSARPKRWICSRTWAASLYATGVSLRSGRPQYQRTSRPAVARAISYSRLSGPRNRRRNAVREMFRPAPCGANDRNSAWSAPNTINTGAAMFSGIKPNNGRPRASRQAGVAPLPWKNVSPRCHTKLCSLPISASPVAPSRSRNRR